MLPRHRWRLRPSSPQFGTANRAIIGPSAIWPDRLTIPYTLTQHGWRAVERFEGTGLGRPARSCVGHMSTTGPPAKRLLAPTLIPSSTRNTLPRRARQCRRTPTRARRTVVDPRQGADAQARADRGVHDRRHRPPRRHPRTRRRRPRHRTRRSRDRHTRPLTTMSPNSTAPKFWPLPATSASPNNTSPGASTTRSTRRGVRSLLVDAGHQRFGDHVRTVCSLRFNPWRIDRMEDVGGSRHGPPFTRAGIEPLIRRPSHPDREPLREQ